MNLSAMSNEAACDGHRDGKRWQSRLCVFAQYDEILFCNFLKNNTTYAVFSHRHVISLQKIKLIDDRKL